MNYDVCVIGGGVVGCAILNKLTRKNLKVVLIEKGNDVALGATKANSGIIHAGFDCKPNTLKAKFNVRGNKLWKELAKQLGVPINNCGALVVGQELDIVKDLYNRGIKNGVSGLHILNREELIKKVPNLSDNITVGLYAETSAISSPYLFAIALAEEAVLNGAKVVFNTEISKCEKVDGGYKLSAKNFEVCAKTIINSAGAGYNEVAKILGTEQHEIEFRRGEYYLLDKLENPITNLTIFPLPSKFSKGVLITPTVHGQTIVGPTSYVSDSSTITTSDGLNEIVQKASGIIKNVPFKKNIRNFAGVRTICGDDFVVELSKAKPNIVNLAGICSPGLTSAPAIAEYVAEKLLNIKVSDKKMIKRKPYTCLNNLTESKRNALIKSNPDYGKIICKCECVSLGEIKEALNSPLKPNSVDAVKRRVRAGMGRCQGGFCLTKVISTISKTCKIPENEVVKENLGSNFYVSNINPNK